MFRQLAGRDAGKATNLELVAGCNKPAKLQPEQTVEVVRNHENGTRRRVGTGCPKVRLRTGRGRLQGYRQRGTLDETQESKARANELARTDRNSVRGAKTMRAAQRFLRISPRGSVGKTTQASLETDQGHGGGREGQTTCYRPSRGNTTLPLCGCKCDAHGPEGHVNLWEDPSPW